MKTIYMFGLAIFIFIIIFYKLFKSSKSNFSTTPNYFNIDKNPFDTLYNYIEPVYRKIPVEENLCSNKN